MQSVRQNNADAVNNAKAGCLKIFFILTPFLIVAEILAWILKWEGPLGLIINIAFFCVVPISIILLIIILALKSSKKLRNANNVTTLINNYREYGSGDWHTTQAVKAIIKEYYRNSPFQVVSINLVNDYGNHYNGEVEFVENGRHTVQQISVTADGSGNVSWDFL